MSDGARTVDVGAQAAAFGALLVALLAPWPFASVEPFWWALAVALVLGITASGRGWSMLRQGRLRRRGLPTPDALPREALVFALALPLVAVLGALPLPAWIVDVISPANGATLARSLPDGVPDWRTLSLFAPATWDATLLAAACAALAWSVADVTRSKRRMRPLLATFVLGGVLIAVFGIVQRLVDPDPQRMFWSVEIYEVGTPFGPYVNRNHFGGAMLLFLGSSIGLLVDAASRRRRRMVVAAGAAAVLFTVVLLATTSRGAVLGAVALVLFVLALAKGSARRKLAMACVGLALVALAGVAAAGLFDELAGRLFHVYGRWRNRFLVQGDALGVFSQFPVVGTGAGTFAWVFHVFQGVDDVRHFNDAHSDWVQFLMETGLVGALYTLALATALARRLVRVAASDAPGRWAAIGTASGLFGIAVHGLVETNLHIPANALLAAAAVGLAYGASIAHAPSRSSPGDGHVDENVGVEPT